MFENRKTLPLIFFILVIGFICLSIFVVYHPIPTIDHQISLFIQRHHSDWLDEVMLWISFFGELPYSLLMVVIVAIIFSLYKFRRESYFITSILLSGLLILAVKNLIDRPRPTQFYVRLVEINRFQSFPSGHVLSYILFFGFLIVLMQTLKNIPHYIRNIVTSISIFYCVMIIFSRIYLGAHWFTDTMGGLILGLISLIILCHFYFKRDESLSVKAKSKEQKKETE